MSDVNINVNETNDIINIVSSEIVEVIDINVSETIEEVTLNITEEVIQVNINKVTGGGGSQNIDQVLATGATADGKTLLFINGGGGNTTEINESFVTIIEEINGDTGSLQGGRVYVNDALGGKELDIRGKGFEYLEVTEKVKVEFETPTGTTGKILFPNVVNATKTLATTDQIPSTSTLVPYTGATSDVNLGEFGLLTGNIEFDNTPTNIPTTAGSMYYNDTDGTLDLILKGGNVKLQIGQESVIRVVNKTATNVNLLEANYQAVRVTGAQGQRLKVDLAQATTDNLSAETIGLVTETINNNQEGFITTSGLVRNINTTGSLQGETWADGDILYLSPTTAGRITKVKPAAPNHLVIIGYVIHSHATQGSIFVKVDNGYELDELHNVKIATATNNQALIYTSSTDIWENKTIIQDSITDGVTTVAPSQNAVFDALALKSNIASPTFTGVVTTPEIALTSTTKGFLPNAVTTTQRNAISSPTAGTMIFNTTEGYPEYFDTFWGWMPLYTSNEWKAKNGVEYFNDLSTSIGGDGMLTSGTASGTVSYVSSSISNRLGLGVLSTSTSATGRAWIGQGVSSTATIMRMGGGRIIYETSVRIPTLSDGTQRFQFLSGLSSTNNSTSISNGILFAYDEGGVSAGSSASANWQVATMNGGTRTWTTTSIPVVAGQFYKLTIEINDACTSVVFKIDGTTVRTETLTLPSATDIGLMTQIYKSIGTTGRTAEVDYISFKQKFTTQR